MAFQSDLSTEPCYVVPQTKRNSTAGLAAILAASLGVGAAVWMIGCSSVKPARTMRFSSTLPAGDYFGGSRWYPSIAVSPDGARTAYVATHNGVTQLYLRQAGEWDGRSLPGTGDAHTPFFSPDGQWLGAVAGGKLVKIPVAGGAPVILAPIPYEVYGACWAADGWIYIGTEAPLGVLKVPAAGGMPLGATGLDKRKRETDHRFPEVLPGGKWLLYGARHADQHTFDEADIEAISKSGEFRTIVKAGTNPHFIPSGHLIFLRAGVLMAVAFDPVKAQVKGTPVAVVEGVIENPRIGAGQFSVSADGSLVYLQGGVTFGERELVFVDRSGATRVLTAKKRPYRDFTLSPDGRLIATTIEGPETDTWIHDIARDTETRFTSGAERRTPAWSADGKRVLYYGYDKDGWSIFWKPLDGSGAEEELADMEEAPSWPGFMSRDGRALVIEIATTSGRRATFMMPFEAGRKPFPRPLIATPSDKDWGQISPDGGWIAFNSDESGRQEVYVATFPGIESKVKISTEGGRHPQWSPNGRELYYLEGATAENPRPVSQRVNLMTVPVETTPAFKAGTPHMLFQGPFFSSEHDYAVTPDGKGFIFIRESQPESGPGELKVVLNWGDELKRRVPVN
jgi:serine/threonine-protein kinase